MPSKHKANRYRKKTQAVSGSVSKDTAKAQGTADAAIELVHELKQEVEQKLPTPPPDNPPGRQPTPWNAVNADTEQKSKAAVSFQGNSHTELIGPSNQPTGMTLLDESEGTANKFMLCSVARYNVPKWGSAIGAFVGATVAGHQELGVIGTSAACVIGAAAGHLLGMAGRYLSDMYARASFKITDSVESENLRTMVDACNKGLTVDPVSLLKSSATLVSQFITADKEVRPPTHQGSQCQKRVPLQLWHIRTGGFDQHVIVNADMLAELIGQNHGKPTEAQKASIMRRTQCPADYNLDASMQATINSSTAVLSQIFLGSNFH